MCPLPSLVLIGHLNLSGMWLVVAFKIDGVYRKRCLNEINDVFKLYIGSLVSTFNIIGGTTYGHLTSTMIFVLI